MITDTEIKNKGLQVLTESLGEVESARFITLIPKEPFDYTKWRQCSVVGLFIGDISQRAMALKTRLSQQGVT